MSDKTLEALNLEFEKAYLFFQQGKFILDASFKKSLFEYLDAHFQDHYSEHDKLFQKFNVFWLENNYIIRPFQLCDIVFEKILSLVYEWEKTNSPNRVHKGTLYYFYGMICILKGEIDKGLLLMHQASNEDGNLGRNTTPSKSFILLDEENPYQFFRAKVVETVNFLNEYISNYCATTSSTFDITNLRTSLLKKAEHKEESFFFVYCIYKLEKIINRIDERIRKNKLASFIETTIIFELCKLCEVLLKKIYVESLIKHNYNNKSDFIHYIDYFCNDNLVSLNLRQNNLGFLNAEIKNNFQNTIQALVNNSYTHHSFISSPSPIEYSIALTYCLRNFGGHKIEEQQTLCNEFEKIVKAIFNFIFFMIEKKY
ncbi:MAG: hypothetical protein KAU20_01675 [Nanoarchaeota archaeon]|nr:hypothetical protein [Nanoarchaeota archaeon]